MQPREPFLLLLFLAQLHSLIQCPLCIIVFALSSAISNQSIELCISINLLFPNAYGEGNFHWCHALYFQRKTSFRPCNVPNWKIFIVNSLLKCIVKKVRIDVFEAMFLTFLFACELISRLINNTHTTYTQISADERLELNQFVDKQTQVYTESFGRAQAWCLHSESK